ncbi:TIGR02453 family protein [Sulfurimonas sp. HSL-1716]|uniref:DUF2461 domain-containing protein n=1 Tax=Hydrocurvibacter sulfurireducens TaxID=3131937 RepID=UPI0031F7231A
MEFGGFSKEVIPFLKDISKNNNKEWFLTQKSRYEKIILEPSRDFVIEMGEHLMAIEPTINAVPKINGSLFRIYKDSRRNKTALSDPIKTRIGYIFWQGNKKRLQSSSFYMHYGIDELFVAVGIRWFEKEILEAYRHYIKNEQHREELAGILQDLKKQGYEIMPPSMKRYPVGFKKEMPNAELSLYKEMAAYKRYDPHLIEEGSKLIDTLYKDYEAMAPLQKWIYEMSISLG